MRRKIKFPFFPAQAAPLSAEAQPLLDFLSGVQAALPRSGTMSLQFPPVLRAAEVRGPKGVASALQRAMIVYRTALRPPEDAIVVRSFPKTDPRDAPDPHRAAIPGKDFGTGKFQTLRQILEVLPTEENVAGLSTAAP